MGLDLFIDWNRILTFRNVQIWVFLSSKNFDLLILRNRISGYEKFKYIGSAVLVGGRSADIQEFCFLAAKCSVMDCVELQGGLFAECQESHIQDA